MARIATSVAVFLSLLFLFTFSYARDIRGPFLESESESKNEREIHSRPETTHSNSKTNQHDTGSLTLSTVESDPVPLTFVSFRPINRHVPRHPLPLPLPSSLRLGNHRCRHGHRRVIPYGNDAIVRSDAAVVGGGFDPSDRGVVRMIPTRLASFRHADPKFPEMIDRQHHHHLYHQIRSKHRKEEQHEEGSFSKKVRMFMNLF